MMVPNSAEAPVYFGIGTLIVIIILVLILV